MFKRDNPSSSEYPSLGESDRSVMHIDGAWVLCAARRSELFSSGG